jgi:molecular chaperone GrpE (heat shock protein)
MSEVRTVNDPEPVIDELEADGIIAVEPLAPTPETPPVPGIEPPSSAEPEPEPQSEPDPVESALHALEARLAEHQRLIERQTEVAANLHAENQRLRAGELRQAQAALVASVLRVLDDVAQMAQTAKVPESQTDLGLVADALMDALARNGIVQTVIEHGAPFDARAHRIAVVEPTADAAADRTVARVVRPGFTWADGGVIRLAEVAVFRHSPVSP